MPKTSVGISSVGSRTGKLLKSYLQERRVYDKDGPGVVCYGYNPGYDDRPILNTHCNVPKVDRMHQMANAGVRLVPWYQGSVTSTAKYPLLARTDYGFSGRDIMPVFQPEEVPWRVAAGWTWFSEYVPIAQEYRVWVFRGYHLATYVKELVHPKEYKFIGRNHSNGFNFVLDHSRQDLTSEAIGAVRALELDFGAVDIILGKDNNIYVLEVNTAPGVMKSHAEPTLALLADHISNWVNEGFPPC